MWWHGLTHFHREVVITVVNGRVLARYCYDCAYTALAAPEPALNSWRAAAYRSQARRDSFSSS